jgi:putative membrane protein insertion efficiency factor
VAENERILRPYQPAWWLQRLILAYRKLISPILGRRCIYLPTCSEYGFDAIEEWGALRGTWMAVKRVGRCNPLREGGFDPVPKRTGGSTNVEVEAH